jgi:hypothetical protein
MQRGVAHVRSAAMADLEHLLHLGNDCQVVSDLAMSLKVLGRVSDTLAKHDTWVRSSDDKLRGSVWAACA